MSCFTYMTLNKNPVSVRGHKFDPWPGQKVFSIFASVTE